MPSDFVDRFGKPQTAGESFVGLVNMVDQLSIDKMNLIKDLRFIIQTNKIENCAEVCDGDCSKCDSNYSNFNWKHREKI